MTPDQSKSVCYMVLLETADLNYFWECSACLALHRDTRKFEKSEACPACGLPIKDWVEDAHDDEDLGTDITLNGSFDHYGK